MDRKNTHSHTLDISPKVDQNRFACQQGKTEQFFFSLNKRKILFIW